MPEDDLTRFELYSLIAKFEEVSLISAGLFLTIISGFLVMSYAIGANLTRRQCWMVLPVFVLAAGMTLLNWVFLGALSAWFYPRNYFAFDRPDSLRSGLFSMDAEFAFSHITTFVVGVMIIAGALIFFRDIRKNARIAAAEAGAGALEASEPVETPEPDPETTVAEPKETPPEPAAEKPAVEDNPQA